jgi:hypothetical protein
MKDSASLRVFPPLRPCLAFAVRLLSMIIGVMLIVAQVGKALSGQPLLPVLLLLQMLACAIGIGLVLGLVLYALMRLWAWTIARDGLAGRSYWGRRRRIAWTRLDSVAAASVEGIPALHVRASDSGDDLFLYTLGVSLQAIHAALVHHAGPDHVLTRSFAAE